MRSPENQYHISMLERDHLRINNISECWNGVTRESIPHQYAGIRYNENQ